MAREAEHTAVSIANSVANSVRGIQLEKAIISAPA
jgi:hypothetical protein